MVQSRCPKEHVVKRVTVSDTESESTEDSRLIPLFASVIELPPCTRQWHNESNANFSGFRIGNYFEGFVNVEVRNLGKTLAEIKAWVPPTKGQRAKVAKGQSGKRKKATKGKSDDGGADE